MLIRLYSHLKVTFKKWQSLGQLLSVVLWILYCSQRWMWSHHSVISWISCTYMVILSPWITQKSFAIQEALIQDETDRHYDEALVYIDVYNFIANLDFKNVKANKYVRSLFFKKSLSHVKKFTIQICLVSLHPMPLTQRCCNLDLSNNLALIETLL